MGSFVCATVFAATSVDHNNIKHSTTDKQIQRKRQGMTGTGATQTNKHQHYHKHKWKTTTTTTSWRPIQNKEKPVQNTPTFTAPQCNMLCRFLLHHNDHNSTLSSLRLWLLISLLLLLSLSLTPSSCTIISLIIFTTGGKPSSSHIPRYWSTPIANHARGAAKDQQHAITSKSDYH